MNCKPGETARVVSTPATRACGIADRTITVTVPSVTNSGLPSWRYEGNRFVCAVQGLEILSIADAVLRPFRDPGDDATDEMIVLLGKPVREGETV